MRLLITGSRDLKHKHVDKVDEEIYKVVSQANEPVTIVVGGNPHGADLYAEIAYDRITSDHTVYPVLLETHKAKWNHHNHTAGHIRNQEMVDLGADICLAFFQDGADNDGTKDCAKKAHEAGIKVLRFNCEE